MTTDKPEQAIDQARKLLQEEQQARVAAAKAELDAFIADWQQRHRVRLEVSMIISARGNMPQLQIVAEA